MTLQLFSFLLAGAVVLTGAIGVVLARNPVHAALFLIQALFGVAVEFLVVEAHFLAAIQIIVYAGAIVILFLFVIMLLGVDQAENLTVEPIIGQRPAAIVTGSALLALLLGVIWSSTDLTGLRANNGDINRTDGATGEVLPNVNQLAEQIFTDYVFAFEVTGLLLTVAVVGAVVLARRIPGTLYAIPESALAVKQREATPASSASDAENDDEIEDAVVIDESPNEAEVGDS